MVKTVAPAGERNARAGAKEKSLREVQLIGGTRAVVLQHDECVVGLAGFLG